MTDKLKILTDFFKKVWLGCKKHIAELVSLIKSHKKESVIVAASVFAVAVVIILVCVFCFGGSEPEKQDNNEKWGTGLTENIPEFSGNADSVRRGNGYVAAYYSNVTGEEITEYLETLAECGIEFESQHYPRSAVLDDKIIAIHYNVTEMRFSVTVTALQGQ